MDTYDAAGRKTKQVRNTTTTTYTYDNADRLTGQQVTGARATFVMDAVGNITVKSQEGTSPQTMTYNAAQRLTTMQDGPTRVTFTYDNNGNTTIEQRGSSAIRTVYAYNRRNEMTKVTLPDETSTTMTYDGDGLRRTKQAASGT
ncbi:MAG: hypothetical protein ACK5ZK_02565, partial [Armatimonadota bacterium]